MLNPLSPRTTSTEPLHAAFWGYTCAPAHLAPHSFKKNKLVLWKFHIVSFDHITLCFPTLPRSTILSTPMHPHLPPYPTPIHSSMSPIHPIHFSIHPLWPPINLPISHYPPAMFPLSLFLEDEFMLSKYFWMCDLPLACSQLPRGSTLRENYLVLWAAPNCP